MTAKELKAIQKRVYDQFNKTGEGGFKNFHNRAAKAYEKFGQTENAKMARKLGKNDPI